MKGNFGDKLSFKLTVKEAVQLCEILSEVNKEEKNCLESGLYKFGSNLGIMDDEPANPEFEWSLLLGRIQYLRNVN